MQPDLKLVVGDREVVPCPDGMRADVERELALRMQRVEDEMAACRHIALEAGFQIAAARIGDARDRWVEATVDVRKGAR